MKSLVTGAAGFIGSHVVDSLIERGDTVIALDDLSGGYRENVNPKATFVKRDICDVREIEWLFHDEKFDYVYHLAAYAAEGLSHFIRRFNYTNNLIGSVNLINNAVKTGVKCFVFTSSIAVYGSAPVPFKEVYEPRPEDPYGIAKLAVELDLKAAHEMFGMNYIIFRPHNVYGERQNLEDPYRNVIGIFMRSVMEGKPCPIFGDGMQQRAFSYIRDVAPTIASSVENPDAMNDVFNMGCDAKVNIETLASIVQEHMGRVTGVEHHPERKEVRNAWCDHSKLYAAFGSRQETWLYEGIEQMAEWAKSRKLNDPTLFEEIEVTKNMPERWRNLCSIRS